VQSVVYFSFELEGATLRENGSPLQEARFHKLEACATL